MAPRSDPGRLSRSLWRRQPRRESLLLFNGLSFPRRKLVGVNSAAGVGVPTFEGRALIAFEALGNDQNYRGVVE